MSRPETDFLSGVLTTNGIVQRKQEVAEQILAGYQYEERNVTISYDFLKGYYLLSYTKYMYGIHMQIAEDRTKCPEEAVKVLNHLVTAAKCDKLPEEVEG